MPVAELPSLVAFVAPPGFGKSAHIEALRGSWSTGRSLVASVPALIRGTPEVCDLLQETEIAAVHMLRDAAWAAAAVGELAPRRFDAILIDLLRRARGVDVIFLDAFPRDQAVAAAFIAAGLADRTWIVRLGCPDGIDEMAISRDRQHRRDVHELGSAAAAGNRSLHAYRADLFKHRTEPVVAALVACGATSSTVDVTASFDQVHDDLLTTLRRAGLPIPADDHVLSVELAEAGTYPLASVGGKAHALGRCSSYGLRVPSGVVLTAAFHQRAFVDEGLDQVLAGAHREMHDVPARSSAVLARVRRRVLDGGLTTALRTHLRDVAGPLLARGPVVVRSSAPSEDGATAAHAGVYHSELDVRDEDTLVAAIRRCWASLLTDRASFYQATTDEPANYTAVIIQQQVFGPWAGVAFTVDPVSGPVDGVIVEASARDTTAVTQGRAPHVRARLPDATCALPPTLSDTLLDCAKTLRNRFGRDVDVEWAFDGHEVHVLQARPITTPPVAVRGIADQEDLPAVRALVLGRTATVFARQLQKKVWLRQECRAAGIPVFPIVYSVYDPQHADREAEAILAAVPGPYLLLNWGDGPDPVSARGLADALRLGAERNLVGAGLACVQVGQLLAAQTVGFSSVTGDGGVLIELYPAGVPGIKSGAATATLYRMQADGSIHERVATITASAEIDPISARWRPRVHAPLPVRLEPAQLEEAVRQTRAVTAALGEARYEFYVCDDRVVSKDVTLESSALPMPTADVTVLAAGTARGRLLRIADISTLDELADRHEVSVFAHTVDDTALRDRRALALLNRLTGPDPVIVHAPYPSVGLIPFADKVAGFAFDQGSVLGHTAIVLRELGVPAVLTSLSPDLHDGDLVQLGPAGVRRVG